QQVCTSATIIGNGRLLASGPVDQLIDSGPAAHSVAVPDVAAALGALEAAGLTARATGDELLVETDDPAAITRALGAADIWLTGLVSRRRDLESVFLELTADDTLGHTETTSGADQ
ncbi:MAG: ABC transporter ATP-binding protein, partial [Nocardioides sp.]